jgi:hypothetical protein
MMQKRTENQSTYFMLNNVVLSVVLLSDNVEKHVGAGEDRDHNTILHMPIAWRITKATGTHSEHVILVSFPRKQWLHEVTPVLRYTYVAILVDFSASMILKENYPPI